MISQKFACSRGHRGFHVAAGWARHFIVETQMEAAPEKSETSETSENSDPDLELTRGDELEAAIKQDPAAVKEKRRTTHRSLTGAVHKESGEDGEIDPTAVLDLTVPQYTLPQNSPIRSLGRGVSSGLSIVSIVSHTCAYVDYRHSVPRPYRYYRHYRHSVPLVPL
eukprot:SAG11_NODE_3874_length_2177_cov_1.636670_1_plen_166_part_00